MDFVQLQSYVAVIECGSLSAAAKKLHMAHSTISNHIRKLEEEQGCQLIQRNTRSMVVTKKGRIFYSYAKKFLGNKAEMESMLRNVDLSPRISIAATDHINFGILPRILEKYRRKRSDIFVSLQEGQAQEILRRLCSNIISIGFAEQELVNKDVECVCLGQSPLMLVVPAKAPYSSIADGAVNPYDLAEVTPCITPGEEEDSRSMIELGWCIHFDTDQKMPAGEVEAAGVWNVIKCVQAGLGFALVPNFVACDLSSDPSVRILPTLPKNRRDYVYMVYRKAEDSPAVLELIQFVKDWAKKNRDCEDIAYFD